jgi:hypothetical protein
MISARFLFGSLNFVRARLLSIKMAMFFLFIPKIHLSEDSEENT